MTVSLADVLGRRVDGIHPMEIGFVRACGRTLLEALAFLHDEASIFHGDINPKGVFFRRYLPNARDPDPATIASTYDLLT